MNIYSVALLGLTSLAFAQTTVQASPSSRTTYALSQQVQGKQTKVSIYERKTHCIVWSRCFPECASVTWSSNRRAVVFIAHYEEYKIQAVYPYRIVIWRAGRGGSEHTIYAYEYTLIWPSSYYFLWSPRSEGILWRTGDGGAVTYDEAELDCIDARTGRNHFVAPSVYSAFWIGPKEVKYQQYRRPQPQPIPKSAKSPHFWYFRGGG